MINIITLLLLGSLLPNLRFTASVNVRIVNGTKASSLSRPYMVSVQKDGEHVCGGFFISDQFVMTAAHCRDDTEILTVVAGAHDLRSIWRRPVHISVSNYNIHPEYNPDPDPGTPEIADLMILKLDTKVQLNKKIKTIPIPKRPVEMNVGTVCSVAGWGSVENGGPTRRNLREANVKIMSNTVCARWEWEYEAPKMMCVYGYGGTCKGDSGGPLVCNNIAVGVTAFGRNNSCNDPDLPNVYTNISEFLPWIQSILRTK